MRTCRLLPYLLMMTTTTLATAQITYPPTPKGDTVDTYHGTKIADPYRWLENDNAPETKAWVAEQNKVTFKYLEAIPQRNQFKGRLETLWNYERFGIPTEHGGRYFFSRNSGLQNQSVIYFADSLQGTANVLLDPNTFSADGTVSLSMIQPSEDGKYLAYGLSRAGSDWVEFHVREVDTGMDLLDTLKWIKFSGASWAKDGSGFYYGRYPKPQDGAALTQKNINKRVYFHKLGTNQDEDPVIFSRPDRPDWGYSAHVTDDGRYLIIHISLGTDPRNRVYYIDLKHPDDPAVELLNDFDAEYGFIDNDGPVFFFHTDLDAPRYRVIAIDTTKPERKNWRTLIPETKDKLENISLVGGQFICEYLHDAHSLVEAHDLEGKLVHEIKLPGLGTTGGFGGRSKDKETFYAYSSFTTPTSIYRYDIATGVSSIYRMPRLDFDASPFETKQVFATSKDGTKVPMFITHRRGLKLDGGNPCLLYGYGGFNISMTPTFSVGRAVWLERGGMYCVACLRGGGEYGAEWHKAGTKLQKQNVFDDFIACAEYLEKEGYAKPEKLAIQGGSNGGLLVGAAITQRPELFGATLPAVGVMDMLRFHQFTIGWAWKSDYGSSEDPKEFAALRAYSPLHNLKPGTRYPATLVSTSDHDDRVVPAHSFKFAATLQECQAKDGPPVLIRIETSAGHGAGTALNKTIEETADSLAFIAKAIGMK